MSDKKPLKHKRKLESTPKFTTAEQIRQSLRTQHPDGVIEALNQLRNQLTIRSDEGILPPQDERLILVEQWLADSPGAQDVFGLWEKANYKQSNLLVAIVAVLSAVVTLLSSHYTYHTTCQPIVKNLLGSQWMRRLNSYIGGTHNELILVTLKLLNAISEFAGGREKKSLLEAFQWEIKSLPKLLTLRRRGKVDYNPLSRPDIRTLYILLLLSFLNGQAQVKTAFLEQHRDAFSAIFKGLSQDHYLLIRHFLEAIWANLWSDPKVKRTLKVGLFNEFIISQLLKIYERTSSDDEDPDHIPADLVHHFLLAIMTRPGIGICFKDRGWYPRDDTEDDKGSKIYNKILGNILKTLKVNEDSRQQELARKILEACPELVSGYWPSAQLTLEPRLSTKWIANIAFLGTIISLPIPQSTFYLPGTDLYNPIPPPLQTVLSNILPFDISPRTIFTKGLLSQSGLVQHCTAQTLVKCLTKYAKVLDTFRVVENVLEGKDTEEGLWAKRRREIEKEVRRRVPEFQVVLGFSHPKPPAQAPSGQNTPAPNPVRTALLQESAQRLLLLYHKHLSEVVSETRFDVGKVLVNFDASLVDEQGKGHDAPPDAAKRLHLVQKLHIIHTLKESDQFVWTNKTSSSHTYLYSILKSYINTSVPSLKSALLDLLSYLLSSSILFENTPNEPFLWFTSIPNLPRVVNAKSPDDVDLKDEAECVVTFLDDCIQRCLKTPFRYIDEMHNTLLTSSTQDSSTLSEIYPSPLIMTLGEQFEAKIKTGLLTPSDVLAIASFIRKLLFRLMGQVQRLSFLEAFVVRLDHILSEDRLWVTRYPSMTVAVRTEVEMMYAVIRPAKKVGIPANPNPSLKNYLESIDGLPAAQENREQEFRAYSIIDQLRFLDQPLSLSDAKRVILAVQSRWIPALQTLVQHLFPRSGSLWVNQAFVGTDIGETIPIEWLLFNATEDQILDSDFRRSFVDAFFSTKPNLQSCIRLIRHLEHALDMKNSNNTNALLSLLAILLGEARSKLNESDMIELKEILFVYPSAFKQLALSHEVDDQVYNGLHQVLQNSFDPSSRTDSRVLSDISTHWAALLQNRLTRNDCNLNLAALWIKYLPPTSMLSLLDDLISEDILSQNPAFISLVQSILDDIRVSTSEDLNARNELWKRASQLLRIRELLPTSPVVEELILSVINSTLPVGLSGFHQYDNRVPLSVEMQQARSSWSRRLLPFDHFSVPDFLTANHWTPSTSKIVANLFYKQRFNVPMFETWLQSEHSISRSHKDLSIVIQAALDVHQFASQAYNSLNPSVWIPHLKNISLLCFNPDVDDHLCQKATSCLTMALAIFTEHKNDLVQVLLEQIELRRSKHPPPLTSIRFGFQISELPVLLLDWSLQWMIGQLADESTFSHQTCRFIETTTSLVHLSTPKLSQVETLLGVIIHHHLHHPSALELANACISKTNLKPVLVNRYLQSILHHSQFIKLSGVMSSNAEARSKIIDLLYTLFNLYPTNTCQLTQVEPIIRVYGGTLSKDDLLLFSIFQLFEVQRQTSLASLFKLWSSSNDVACSSPWESLQTLDPGRVFQTTLHYPKWRKLNADPTSHHNDDCHLYDPVFLLLLYQLVLFQDPPTTAFRWIELFRTNIVGLCIRALSSKDPPTRTFGLCQLSSLHKLIENVPFQEKPHVTHIFNLLKDLLPPPSPDSPPPRLPTYTTLLLSHALRGIFYPSNFIYPLTAKFLLQRPELDTGDVPMLYSMLYSNTDDWKKERGWIIRFLADGMASFADWRILKRRHAWDLLASLFEGSRTDLALRRGVFEVLASLTSNRQAVTAMIFTTSFLAWLETQILQSHADENLKWAKILTNTVLVVDHNKLDSSLTVSWRACIYRCLCTLLGGSNAHLILPVIVIAMFRLSQTSEPVSSGAKECISLAARALELYETHLDVSGLPHVTADDHSGLRHSLYSSHSIHEPTANPHSLATWFDCLTLLWRTAMTLEEKSSSWDEFTFKLLASCNYTGRLENAETQWIRKQVVSLQGIDLSCS